ncbi:hypothetical protein WR25_02374 [Diploscapter pachys]|uniref:Uncharacterized protein n=1 Tax=Diploscapter pachys TaxID=2018661 RepID=A0A2A2K0C8_9BILA|nr:hypothetical protein WR25_02374 [Diploscapter pachys]
MHLAVGPAVAAQLFQPVARGEGAGATAGADALVGSLHGADILAGQHQAGALAVLQDRQQVADHGLRAQADDTVVLARAVLQGLLQVQLGAKGLQWAAERRAGRQSQQLCQCRVERLHQALHGIEVAALGDFDALAVEDAKGLFERLAHGVLAQRQHALQPGLLGQLHHGRRADDAATAQPGGVIDGVAGLLKRGIGGLVHLHGEQRRQCLQVLVDVVVAEHGHLRAVGLGLPQGAQQVAAADAHCQYWPGQVLAQVGGGGPCADEHIDFAALLQLAGGLQRFGYRGVEHLDTGVGVIRREPAHDLGETAALPRALQVADQHDDLGGGGVHGGPCSWLQCFNSE